MNTYIKIFRFCSAFDLNFLIFKILFLCSYILHFPRYKIRFSVFSHNNKTPQKSGPNPTWSKNTSFFKLYTRKQRASENVLNQLLRSTLLNCLKQNSIIKISENYRDIPGFIDIWTLTTSLGLLAFPWDLDFPYIGDLTLFTPKIIFRSNTLDIVFLANEILC